MTIQQTKATYDNDSISMLKGADRVRLRPAVIFGSDDIEGCQHAFFEILSNSLDEAREGHGTRIRIKRYADHALEIEDFGRGIPLDYNPKEKRYNWELVFCELYAGGKYRNASGGNYAYSLGLNGLGACATQYASRWFDVRVRRDGYEYNLHFEKGENKSGLQKTPYKGRQTGTLQRWLPDPDVFTETEIPIDFFRLVLKQQAIVNAGISFEFEDQITGVKESYLYPSGILGYVEELNADDPLTKAQYFEAEGEGRDRQDKEAYKAKVELAFAFNNHQARLSYFHNSSFLEHGGSPDRAARTAFVTVFDRLAKEREKYKANESKITFADLEDSLILISSSFSTQTSYENQTKKAINNRFIQDFMNKMLKERLEVWAIENLEDSNRALEQVLINKRSRESAERQRLNVRKQLMGKMDFSNRVKKFVDCRSKDVKLRELYIVEGDSALGSTKLGRDAEFQAIIPVRGKILNCLKSDLGKIFKNEIITDLLKVLGCGVEIQQKHAKDLSSFDLSALRWRRIIICTDADVDGYQIRTLILAMFYRLTPTLLREGRIYIAESPLFEITVRQLGRAPKAGTGGGRGARSARAARESVDEQPPKEETLFAYSEKEKAEILKSFEGKRVSVSIQRSKGLGENEPEMMWETTMNPMTRRLIQVLPEDAEAMARRFELLLGDDLTGRKEHIRLNGRRYLDQLDLA